MVNKKPWLLLILCLALLLPGYSYALNVTSRTIQYKDKLIEVNIAIPIISGAVNKPFQQKANRLLQKQALDFKREIEKQAKQNFVLSQQQGFPYHLHTAVSRFDVTYNQNGIVSIPVEFYSYTGGAHGITVKIPHNFDFNQGKELKLSDLFKKGSRYQQVIVEEIVKQIEKEPDMYFGNAVDVVKELKDGQPYYLTPKGMVVYYGVYEIAPYAAGIREFLIPFSTLKPYLRLQL